MDEYIERGPLLKAFKEKTCKGCHGGYDKEKCGGRCDAADEIALIEAAPVTTISGEAFFYAKLRIAEDGPREVTEMCPYCDREVTLLWDVKADGYKAICPFCGKRLMLCDECNHPNGEYCGKCDYNRETDSCKHNPPEPPTYNGWYLTAQKRPTEADADANSCVLSFNLNPGDQRVTNWLWNIVAAFPENFPIWMPIPELPKGVKRENRPR